MHKSTFYIVFLAINANLGAFFFGYQIGVLNMGQETVDYHLGINSEVTRALVNASVPFGALFGSIFSTYLMKKTGRKWSLIIADLIGICGCLLTLFSTLTSFFAYRIIAGFSTGLNSALVPIYVTEFSPVSLKGLTGSINGIFIPFGILVSYLLGMGYDTEVEQSTSNYWLFVFIFPSITSIVRTICLLTFFHHDTPLHHIENDNHEDAKVVLDKIYHPEHVDDQFDHIHEQHQSNKKNDTTYINLFKNRHLRKRLHIGCSLQVIQQTSGIVAVIFYSDKIFNNSTDEKTAFWLSCVFTLLLMITALVSGILLKYFGRKTILITGQIIVIFFEIMLAVSSYIYDNGIEHDVSQVLIIIGIFGFTLGYGISIGPIVWLYNAEILPDKGVSISTLTNWVMVILISFVFPLVNESLGTIWPIFAFFAVCVILGLLFVISQIKETKGLNPRQIEDLFGVISTLGGVKYPILNEEVTFEQLTDNTEDNKSQELKDK